MFELFAIIWKTFVASLATAVLTITPTPSSVPNQPTQPAAGSAVNIGSAGTSHNWSGYASTNGNFTSVSATWIIPQVTGNGHTAADATWLGIGGIKTNDLIQAGTLNVINPSGQVTSSAFYELLPNVSQNTTSIEAKPGDSITTSITQQSTANQWLITIQDNTTNQSYQTTVTYTSSLSSAEWIEEAPSSGTRILPLDNFGTTQFTGGTTIQNGTTVTIASSGASPITMINAGGQILATPSSLGGDGASFTVTRSSAISNAPIPEFDRNPRGWRRRGIGIGQYNQFPEGLRNRWGRQTATPTPTVTTTTTPIAIPTPGPSDFMDWRRFKMPNIFLRRHP